MIDSDGRRTKVKTVKQTNVSSGLYGLGFIGALIYYIQYADSFGQGLLGILKALVWPAILIYDALKFLNGG